MRLWLSDGWADPIRGVVVRRGRSERLPPREADLLAELGSQAGSTVSREVLARLWGAEVEGRQALDALVSRLRQKLEPDPRKPVHLITVHGVGYRLVPDSRPEHERPDAQVLPGPRGALVGREAELRRLDAQVLPGALVTLVGPPGVGKSTLAGAFVSRFTATGGRARVLALQSCTSTEEVRVQLSLSLGARDLAGADLRVALAAAGPMLLVLDNVEHLPELHALLEPLVPAAPAVAWLCTSRAPVFPDEELEHVFPVELLSPDAALRLLQQRLAQVGALDPPPEAARDLVDALDRLPLAIELAASRGRAMSVFQMHARLTARFRLLADRRPDQRFASLRAALAWSWELLTVEQRTVLAQCTVFRGGFTAEVAEVVVESGGDAPVSAALEELRAHSLLTVAAGRWGLLASVQAFVEEEVPRQEPAEIRHGRALVALAERADALEVERANLVVAARRALDRRDRALAAPTVLAAYKVLARTGPLSEACALLEQARALTDGPGWIRLTLALGEVWLRSGQPRLEDLRTAAEMARTLGETRLRASALYILGHATERSGDPQAGLALLQSSIETAREVGDLGIEATASGLVGWILRTSGRFDEGWRATRRALELHQATQNRWQEGIARGDVAGAYLFEDKLEEAERDYELALDIHREVGNRQHEAAALGGLASVCSRTGRTDRAAALFDEAITLLRQLGDRAGVAVVLGNLGSLYLRMARIPQAEVCLREALGLHREVGNPRDEGIVLGNLANAVRVAGRLEEAETLFGEALEIAEALDAPLSQASLRYNLSRSMLDRASLDEARAQLIRASALVADLANARMRAMIRGDLARLVDLEEATRLVELAEQDAREAAGPELVEQMRCVRAEVLLRSGHRPQAQALLRDVRAALDALGAAPDTEARRLLSEVSEACG